jgi:hypothetical protein
VGREESAFLINTQLQLGERDKRDLLNCFNSLASSKDQTVETVANIRQRHWHPTEVGC